MSLENLFDPVSLEPEAQHFEPDPLVGQRIGSFVVEAEIARGGTGIIYRALHVQNQGPVAIKVLRPEMNQTPELVAQLVDEARAAQTVKHAGIIEIFHAGALPDQRRYLVMECLEGHSLEKLLLQEPKLTIPRVLELLQQIAEPLAAAHAVGIVHRDLKPQNIFVLATPAKGRLIKILDFGLAKRTSVPTGSSRARNGTFLGTPQYMSPEQVQDQPVTDKSDIYSLGVIAYQMLTGWPPFLGNNLMQLMMAHVEDEVVPPRQVNPAIPGDISSLVLRCLSKMPAVRPSGSEVLNELQAIRSRLSTNGQRNGPRLTPVPSSAPAAQLLIESPKSVELPAERRGWPRRAFAFVHDLLSRREPGPPAKGN